MSSRHHRLGLETVLIERDEIPSAELSRRLAAAAARLRQRTGVRDAVPGYSSLAIYHDPLALDHDEALRYWERDWELAAGDADARDVVLDVPVRYDGPDLETAAAACGIDVPELIARHGAPLYTVAMIGFRPYFPYLLGLDPSLVLPRRKSPRQRVPAGTVAIAGEQAGIYPEDSPGGWHCLGRCDPALCRRLEPGMSLRFVHDA